MTNDAPKSSKLKGKQPDLRKFMFKRMKPSEGNSCPSLPPSNEDVCNEANDSPSSPSISIPQTQENDMEIGGSSDTNVPLEEEEWLYDVEKLPHDPGKRINIMNYPPKQRNAVRRAYILKGPFQPKTHNFPQRECGGLRRFSVNWFKKWDWLEYSIEKDAAFCFVCYLYKHDVELCAGGDAFVDGGFRSWNKPERFERHVGGVKSAHNQAYEKYVNLKKAKTKSIYATLEKANKVVRSEYELCLRASLTCLKFLLRQGLTFRGHDESEESFNRGNFLQPLKWLGENCDDAPKNNQMTSPMIQKYIINCCAKETTKCIIEELGDDYFGILADESSDIAQKEQLTLVL